MNTTTQDQQRREALQLAARVSDMSDEELDNLIATSPVPYARIVAREERNNRRSK